MPKQEGWSLDDKWEKLRQIVREEGERVEARILAAIRNGKAKLGFENGRWIGITEEQQEAWKAAYPAVDVQTELKRASAWILSNPMQAPKSNYPRFLNTWLTRQQNQASLRSIPSVRSIAEKRCRYCARAASGSVNGYEHCSEHIQSAMDSEKPLRLMGG